MMQSACKYSLGFFVFLADSRPVRYVGIFCAGYPAAAAAAAAAQAAAIAAIAAAFFI